MDDGCRGIMHRQGIPTWHPQTLESPPPARWLGTRGDRLESAFTGGNEKTLVPDLRRDPGGALSSSSLPLSQPRVLSILTCKSLYPGPLPQVRDVAGFLQASAVAQTPWRQRALHSWGLWWLCSGPARSPYWARSPPQLPHLAGRVGRHPGVQSLQDSHSVWILENIPVSP